MESPIGILRSKPERRIGLDEQMNYEEEFAAANARRQLFGKKKLPFQKSEKWFLDPNTLNGMVYAIRGETESTRQKRWQGIVPL